MDRAALVEVVVEQLRAGDEIPLRRLLLQLPREFATYSKEPRGINRAADTLDRCAALLIEFLVIGRNDLFNDLFHRLVASFESAVANPHPASAFPAPVLGLMQMERVYAVGAFAVREKRFDLVARMAAERVQDGRTGLSEPWLVTTQRVARQHDFLKTVDAHRPEHTWLIGRALDAVSQNEWLAPDAHPGDEGITTSLCEFDLLVSVASMNDAGHADPRFALGNFAGWFSGRTDPMAVTLVDEQSPVRQAVCPRDDEFLANALAVIENVAQTRWGVLVPAWDGFEDARVSDLIATVR